MTTRVAQLMISVLRNIRIYNFIDDKNILLLIALSEFLKNQKFNLI